VSFSRESDRKWPVLSAALVFVLMGATVISSGCNRAPAATVEPLECEVTSHSDGDTVVEFISVEGTVTGLPQGWSMYSYARAKLMDQPWWLSAHKATVVAGEWSIGVNIGNPDTVSGTGFEVVIIAAEDDPHEFVDELPDSVEGCAKLDLIRE